jgi:enediyne biosynthesis protein E3
VIFKRFSFGWLQVSHYKSSLSRICTLRHWRRQIFQLSIKETSPAHRGFIGSRISQHLERIRTSFLRGYNAAVEDDDPSKLTEQLNAVDLELRGFSFEGAAMGLALLDVLTPWKRNRWTLFFHAGAVAHKYMMHVGVGWAMARLPAWFNTHAALADPLLGWLVIDGYGFHQGYFDWRRYVIEQKIPERLSGYACRVFDQGLGRSLWFVEGADASRISTTIASFDRARQSDLWSGVGLACAYAGGADVNAIESLRGAAGAYRPQLAQGVAFAAKTRQRAGNKTENLRIACQIICELSDDEAAQVTDDALAQLSDDGCAYEIWRTRIQTRFA